MDAEFFVIECGGVFVVTNGQVADAVDSFEYLPMACDLARTLNRVIHQSYWTRAWIFHAEDGVVAFGSRVAAAREWYARHADEYGFREYND